MRRTLGNVIVQLAQVYAADDEHRDTLMSATTLNVAADAAGREQMRQSDKLICNIMLLHPDLKMYEHTTHTLVKANPTTIRS